VFAGQLFQSASLARLALDGRFSLYSYMPTTPGKRFVLFELYPYIVADPSPGEAKIRVLTEVTLASGEDRSTVQTREHALALKITRPLRGDSKERGTVHVHNWEVSPTEFDLAGKMTHAEEGVRAWIL